MSGLLGLGQRGPVGHLRGRGRAGLAPAAIVRPSAPRAAGRRWRDVLIRALPGLISGVMCAALRVLRLCSVFEPPASALAGRGARFDPIGGMQEHTGSLTRALARRGVAQVVITARPPTAPWLERPDARTTVIRVALPVRRPRQLYAIPAAAVAPIAGAAADLVHVHLGEDLAILPLAALAARPRRCRSSSRSTAACRTPSLPSTSARGCCDRSVD